MRRRVVAIVVCVSLAVLVAAAMAQQLAPSAGAGSKTAADPFAEAPRAPLASSGSTSAADPLPETPKAPSAGAGSKTAPVPFAQKASPYEKPELVDPTQTDPRMNVIGNVGVDYTGSLTLGFVRDPTQAVNELVEKWKQAGNKSDRDKVQQALHAALKEQFQARLKAHEKEIDQLEAEVKRLREQLELRRKKQDEIVEFRLEQLLREAQGLGWGTEPVTQSHRALFLRQPPGLTGSISRPDLPSDSNSSGGIAPIPVPTQPGSNYGGSNSLRRP
ncbi:MAG: hypothetical protein ABSG53_18475 [Thermoguttaceae bacterium]